MPGLTGLSLAISLALLTIGAALVLLDDLRWVLLALLLQFLTSSVLLSLNINFQLGAAKLITGLLSCAIIAFSLARGSWRPELSLLTGIPTGRGFRFAAVILVGLTAIAVGSRNWLQVPSLAPVVLYGSTIVFAFGLLQAGLFQSSTRMGIGLLSLVTGFEILHSAIEPSLAISTLLASVHFGIALIIGYMVTMIEPAVLGEGPER